MFTLEASVAAINYLVLALLLGSLVANVVLLRAADSVALQSRLARIALALACAFLVTHFAALLVQGAKLSGDHFPTADLVTRYVLRTQSGQVWSLRAVYGLAFLLLAFRFARRGTPSTALLFLSLPLVASRSLSGHAVATRDNTWLIVAADSIHLIATACWAGGLPFLLYLLISVFRAAKQDPITAGVAVKRFSRLAFFCVAILLATGVYQSWTHVGRLDSLISTEYGRVLVLKLTIFAGMLILGAVNFFFTKPALLRASRSTHARGLRKTALRRIGAESVLGLLILLVSGFLTALPPAAHSDHRATITAGAHSHGMHKHEDHEHRHHDSRPAAQSSYKPADGASVKIVSPQPSQAYEGDAVPIEFELIKGKRGHHVHAYVDNELMGMFEGEKGTLTSIAPGKHLLKLRVVEADHTTELDATDEVEFIVIAPLSSTLNYPNYSPPGKAAQSVCPMSKPRRKRTQISGLRFPVSRLQFRV